MQILRGHTDVVRFLAFSPDGSLLASASTDGTVRLWPFPVGGKTSRVPEPVVRGTQPFIQSYLAFSPDGRWLASAGLVPGVAAWVWDLAGPSSGLQLPLTANDPAVHQWTCAVAFTADGRHLVATGQRGSDWSGLRHTRMEALHRRWEVGTWAELPRADFDIGADTFWRQPWALSRGAGLLATPAYRHVLFWDMTTGRNVFAIEGDRGADPGALAFSPDGSRFAVARGRYVTVCDVPGQRIVTAWKNPTPKFFLSLAFSPDGRTLATVSNDTAARLWDADTGTETAAFAWELGPLKAVAFAADGMRAAASGKKGAIVVWDVD
jgi:WD40 repeat protein